MISDIYLVHHSHTDYGYTHPQPVVRELHRRFVDQALAQIELTRAWPEESRFRWTCESAAVALDWWEEASGHEHERFLAAAAAGQLEVAALAWNATPLLDHQMLLGLLSPARALREAGLSIRTAMNSDVNGLPWGIVDALLDHGINGLTMAVNAHFGYAPQPRPRPFLWRSPSGRDLLTYNGLHYGVSPQYLLRVPADLEEARAAIPTYLRRLEASGYPHRLVMMQVTHPILFDNAPPQPRLSDFVRAWNDSGQPARLRIATVTDFLDAIRAEGTPLEVARGDWTDWWNFGSGSTAFETTLLLDGQRKLLVADQLAAWPLPRSARHEALRAQAERGLGLFGEHTWGAERSVSRPLSPETRIQWGLKAATAFEGYSLARMLARDGLHHLATAAAGPAASLVAFNPLPYPVKTHLRIPAVIDDEALSGEVHAVHRQDAVEGDARWVGPLDLPALGYATFPIASLPSAREGLESGDHQVANDRLRVAFDSDRGGVRSLLLDGEEYVEQRTWNLCTLILERPVAGDRQAIYGPPRWQEPETTHTLWHPQWQAERQGPVRLIESRPEPTPGCLQYRQTMEMTNGDLVTCLYRVFAGRPALDVEVKVRKRGDSDPHSLYLAIPARLATPGAGSRCHYETAGAIVELDAEQIPYASRHYLTTLGFLRLQDSERGLTVAAPDAPLWQVGGFTFGRHSEGAVSREEALLLAWLTNNYWDTNFQADQIGELTFRFRLLPHRPQELEASLREARTFTHAPVHHLIHGGEARIGESGQLLAVEPDGTILTQMRPSAEGVRLDFLNPTSEDRTVRVAAAALKPEEAWTARLDGTFRETLPAEGGVVSCRVPSRAWLTLLLRVS